MATATGDVLVGLDGSVGLLTLDRPAALNALTHPMVSVLAAALTDWARDDAVSAIVLRGAGERGLCAGGDVVAIHRSARVGGEAARAFWRDEYALNRLIAGYPKPVVSLMDGIVMGGGVGLGAHADVRVVTDTSSVGMPEVGIGFVPDVGGSYLLSRAPGRLGLHPALTGAPFTGADAIALGFADHFVAHDDLDAFVGSVVADGVNAALGRHAVPPPPSPLAGHRDWIDACFDRATVAGIVAALHSHGTGPALDAAATIATRSPTALAVTLESVRRAADLSLDGALAQEYRVSCAALRSHDLLEGIRAQLIDKDRTPTWRPAQLAAVTAADVDAYFAPATDDDPRSRP